MKRSFTPSRFSSWPIFLLTFLLMLWGTTMVQAQCSCPSFPSGPSIGISGNRVVGQPITFSISTFGFGPNTSISFCSNPNFGVTGIVAPCGPAGCNTRVAVFNQPGTYTIAYTATTFTGIGSTQSRNCRSITISSGIPNAGFTYTNLNGSNNNVLPGNVVRFNNTSSQATSYSWQIPAATYVNGTTPLSANPEVIWNSGGFNSNIVLTANGLNGTDLATGSVGIQIPSVNASFSYSPANPVTGQVVTLVNTTSGSGSASQYNYSWTISGGATFVGGTNSSSFAPQILWNSTGLNSISLQACYQPGSYCNSSPSQNIQVYTPVNANFTINTNVQSANSACTGNRVTINNLTSGATTYSWNFNGAYSPNTTVFEPEAFFFTPGLHDIVLTASNGPISDQHTVQIYVYDPYNITETYTPATNSTCTNGGLDVNITYNSTNLNPTSFSWVYVPTLQVIPGLNTNHIVANGNIAAGNYDLVYFDNIGCGKLVNIDIPCNNGSMPRLGEEREGDFLEQMEALGAGTLLDADAATALEIYPNPFARSTTLAYELTRPATVTLNIYNNLGQVVAELVQEMQNAGPQQLEFDRVSAGLPAGMYLVHLQADEQVLTQKLMITE